MKATRLGVRVVKRRKGGAAGKRPIRVVDEAAAAAPATATALRVGSETVEGMLAHLKARDPVLAEVSSPLAPSPLVSALVAPAH